MVDPAIHRDAESGVARGIEPRPRIEAQRLSPVGVVLHAIASRSRTDDRASSPGNP